ncbi:MAG: ABC transporter ATP-binding protein [Acidimicrobiales bacterium]
MESPLRPTAGGGAALRADGVCVHFAGVRAVDEVDLEFRQGEILGLIGPNGAGKTTLVNALTGFQPLTAGSVGLDGIDVSRWPADRLARNGVTRTFQGVRLFADLSVRENVEVAALGSGVNTREARGRADDLLELLELVALSDRLAGELPYGAERRVGIARALATAPNLVMLDEPAAGLNEEESDDLLGRLETVRAELGCGLLVIEHDMRLVMRLCDRLHVLDYGRTIFQGLAAEARRDSRVIEAYLGPDDEGDDA